jgi:hypothetical protein
MPISGPAPLGHARTSKSPQLLSQHDLSTSLVRIIYIYHDLTISYLLRIYYQKRNANMACRIKIRDLHSNSNSFLEPQHAKQISKLVDKNLSAIINHYLPVRRPVEANIIISYSTIVADDNIHCSRVINLNFLLVFRVDLVPVKPFQKQILMAQPRWNVAIATKSAVCGAVQ